MPIELPKQGAHDILMVTSILIREKSFDQNQSLAINYLQFAAPRGAENFILFAEF